MCSILDIDLDYFALAAEPVRELSDLLAWAGRPVGVFSERHGDALRRWVRLAASGSIPAPTHILHVDEHHDMMDVKARINDANVMCRAMLAWPSCRVHWLAREPIDSPSLWLPGPFWRTLRRRFSQGASIPAGWQPPDLVSVCTSPEFLPERLREELSALALAFGPADARIADDTTRRRHAEAGAREARAKP